MSKVRVKICGIRTFEEARAALDLGADAIGFNFWPPSPRYVDPALAKEIAERLPPFLSCIGVFVNERAELILDVAGLVRLSGVQLHGDESPEFCNGLGGLRIIKAIRVTDSFDLSALDRFSVSSFLLDTHTKGSYGGTGRRFDWSIAAAAARKTRIILAGGLTAENVGEALAIVRPFGVDVCSGVEEAPGRKDFARMKRFIQQVRTTEIER